MNKKSRILLSEDTSIIKKMERDLGEYQPLLKEVKRSYEDLGLGNFSNEIFNQVKYGNIQEILIKLNNKIDKEIEKLGLTNDILKGNLKNGSLSPFNAFKRSVNSFLTFDPKRYTMELSIPRLDINHISFESGSFCFSDENQENILEESCRVYVETENEHIVHEDLMAFIKSFEKLKSNLDKMGFPIKYGVREIEKNFLILKDEKVSIIPTSIHKAAEAEKIKEQIRRQALKAEERRLNRLKKTGR